jgi:hypothetical protein
LFDNDFYNTHFEKDFTLFALRERAGGVWPGYVFKRKEGDMASLSAQIDAIVKGSPSSLGSLFLFSSGNATGTFSEFQVVGQTVSMIQFTSPRAVVAYGWFFNKYLIVSTSEAGLREAVRRL